MITASNCRRRTSQSEVYPSDVRWRIPPRLCDRRTQPLYQRFHYNNNVIGSVNLINPSVNHSVRCFIFSKYLDARNNVKVAFSDYSKADSIFGGQKKTSLEMGAGRWRSG
jgi:hypothetical protein